MPPDIFENVCEFGDESCGLDAGDGFVTAADESTSSCEDENVNEASM